MIEVGLRHTSRLKVEFSNTAQHMGSGDLPVFSTPIMVALMENAAMLAVADHLDDADTTVGAYIASSHLSPSPIGVEVAATAILTKIEGRKLHFEVEAYEGGKLIGKGSHIRFIVNKDKFMSKASQERP